MDRSLNIAIGEDNEDHRILLQRTLERLGHSIIGMADCGSDLVELCQEKRPDLVITDIKMPDMDGLAAAAAIYRDSPMPIIVVTSHLEEEYVKRAELEHILAFLVKPITEKELIPAIAIVMRRFEEFEELRKENATLQQSLQDRKIIERAKGLLQQQGGMSESEAFRRLQKLARDKRKKLVEIATAIVTADEALG